MKYTTFSLSLLTIPALMSTIQAGRVTPAVVKQEVAQLRANMVRELQDQLFDFAIRASYRKGNDRLRTEMTTFIPEACGDQQGQGCADIKGLREVLTPEQKEHVLRTLSVEAREMVFTELSIKLMGNDPEPFRIPVESSSISQLDTFYLLAMELIDHDPNYKPLTHALDSCLGLKVANQVKTRLNTDHVNPLIPETFKTKFFTNDPVRIYIMIDRIQKLANSYRNK